MKNSKIGEFTRYSLTTSLTQGFLLICAVASSIITARLLGPAGKGQMSLALLIPILATTFGRMGLGHANNYYSSKIEKSTLILNSAILGAIIACIVVFFTATIIHFCTGKFFGDLDSRLLVIVVSFIPFYLFNNILLSLIQGMYQISIFNILNLLQAMLNLLFLFIAVYFFKLGVVGAVLAYVSAVFIVVFAAIFFLARKVDLKIAKLDWPLIGNLLKFGSRSHIGNILKDLSYRGDILIISYFLPSASVGCYVVAVTVAEVLWKFPDAIGAVLLPKVAGMKTEAARAFTPKACRMIIIPVILTLVPILIFGRPIITGSFGLEYESSVNALFLLLPGVLSLSIWKILANDLIAQGYPTLYSITSGVALLAMIVADIALIPIFGINGASMSSSISYLLATFTIIYFYTKLTGNKVGDLLIPNREDILYSKDVIMKLYGCIHFKRI